MAMFGPFMISLIRSFNDNSEYEIKRMDNCSVKVNAIKRNNGVIVFSGNCGLNARDLCECRRALHLIK